MEIGQEPMATCPRALTSNLQGSWLCPGPVTSLSLLGHCSSIAPSSGEGRGASFDTQHHVPKAQLMRPCNSLHPPKPVMGLLREISALPTRGCSDGGPMVLWGEGLQHWCHHRHDSITVGAVAALPGQRRSQGSLLCLSLFLSLGKSRLVHADPLAVSQARLLKELINQRSGLQMRLGEQLLPASPYLDSPGAEGTVSRDSPPGWALGTGTFGGCTLATSPVPPYLPSPPSPAPAQLLCPHLFASPMSHPCPRALSALCHIPNCPIPPLPMAQPHENLLVPGPCRASLLWEETLLPAPRRSSDSLPAPLRARRGSSGLEVSLFLAPALGFSGREASAPESPGPGAQPRPSWADCTG